MAHEAVGTVVAASAAMKELLEVAGRLTDARTPVLVQGESGTGKDLLVHWLHYNGARRDAPLVKIHCPSIPEDLLESELFGHERGAFTDARQAKAGKIEMAGGGTVFFDQIEDLSLALQAKLLRVVEERAFERIGGTRTIEVDVRFVCAASVDLRKAVAAGAFRGDLFHRLGVVPLTLPPLRVRREDILPLAELFLARERQRRPSTAARAFAPAAAQALRGYSWPGTVRELKGVVERSALVSTEPEDSAAALPAHVREQPSTLWMGRDRGPSLRDVEQEYIRYVLERVSGSQTRAAAILGISRKALWEKRRRYGIP
jgi:DNA-binding NtrC family response regulator